MKNVKRIFFEDGCDFPFFEMEDGEVKVPVVSGCDPNATFWVAEEEIDERNQKAMMKGVHRANFIRKRKIGFSL